MLHGVVVLRGVELDLMLSNWLGVFVDHECFRWLSLVVNFDVDDAASNMTGMVNGCYR